MMKKKYMKPAMQVVQLQQRTHILTVSGQGAKSLNNSEGFTLYNDLDGDDV